MQSLICGIATTRIQHRYLPFEVTENNELPPLSLGCIRWRQLEVLPANLVAVKVNFFVYKKSSLPKNQWSLLTFLSWHSMTVCFIMHDSFVGCPQFMPHVNLTESMTKVSLWSHMKRRRMWEKLLGLSTIFWYYHPDNKPLKQPIVIWTHSQDCSSLTVYGWAPKWIAGVHCSDFVEPLQEVLTLSTIAVMILGNTLDRAITHRIVRRCQWESRPRRGQRDHKFKFFTTIKAEAS